MADAIVEAKGGLLSVAHSEDENEEDVTMKDVIVNVEEQIAENERRRRQRMEERRNRRPYDRNARGPRRDNGRAPFVKQENKAAEETAKPAETVKEEAPAAPAADAAAE